MHQTSPIILCLYVVLFVAALACGKKGPSELEVKTETLARTEWTGETAQTDNSLDQTTITLLGLAGIPVSNDAIDFTFPITQIKAKFNADGTLTGTGLNNQTLNGTWEWLSAGQKIKVSGLGSIDLSQVLPPNILALIPANQRSLALPEEYEVLELVDAKFVIKGNTSRTFNIPNPISSFPPTIAVQIASIATISFVR